MKEVVIDASGLVLGRLASVVAKRLLMGERVIIINAEKALISCNKRKSLVDRFKERLRKRTHYNPEKTGPKWPRRPDGIVRRTIRGMLPRKTPRGRAALKRLRVYIGVPEHYAQAPKETIPEALPKSHRAKYITVAEVAKELGWRP